YVRPLSLTKHADTGQLAWLIVCVVQSTVVWAARLSIGNKRFRPPCGTKTSQTIKTKFGRGDHVGKHIRSAKKIWGSVERWRPHAVAVCQTFVTSFSPFFPHPAYRSDATFAYHVLCIKRRGSVDTRAFWGEKVATFHILGVSGPKTFKISPQTGKSHLNLKWLITFKR